MEIVEAEPAPDALVAMRVLQLGGGFLHGIGKRAKRELATALEDSHPQTDAREARSCNARPITRADNDRVILRLQLVEAGRQAHRIYLRRMRRGRTVGRSGTCQCRSWWALRGRRAS